MHPNLSTLLIDTGSRPEITFHPAPCTPVRTVIVERDGHKLSASGCWWGSPAAVERVIAHSLGHLGCGFDEIGFETGLLSGRYSGQDESAHGISACSDIQNAQYRPA